MVPSLQPFNFFQQSQLPPSDPASPKTMLNELASEVAQVQSRCADLVSQGNGASNQVIAMREAVDQIRSTEIDIPGKLMPFGQKVSALIYDTETGDLAARKVVEWASVKLELEQLNTEDQPMVRARLHQPLLLHFPKPDVMSTVAVGINHYTDVCFEELAQKGAISSWQQASERIIQDLESADLTIAHNAPFDYHAMKLSLLEEGLVAQARQVDNLLKSKWVCTSSMAWACLRNWRDQYFEANAEALKGQGLTRRSAYQTYVEKGHPVPFMGTNLGNLYETFFNQTLDNAHSAAADVYGAAAVFLKLLAEGVNPYELFKEKHESALEESTSSSPAQTRRRSAQDQGQDNTVNTRPTKRPRLTNKPIALSEINNVVVADELKKYVVKLVDHDRRHIIAKSEIEAFLNKAIDQLGYDQVKEVLHQIPAYLAYEQAMRDPELERQVAEKGLVDFSNPEVKKKRLFLPMMWIRFNLFVGSGPENRLIGRLMHSIRDGRADKQGTVRLLTEKKMLKAIDHHSTQTPEQRMALVKAIKDWIGALKVCLPDRGDRDMAALYFDYKESDFKPSKNIDESLALTKETREMISDIQKAAVEELTHLAQSDADPEVLKKAARSWVKNLYDSVSFDVSQARVPGIRRLQHQALIPLYQQIHQHLDEGGDAQQPQLTAQVLKSVVSALYELDENAVRWGEANPEQINQFFEQPIRSLTVSDLSERDPDILPLAGRAYARMIGTGADFVVDAPEVSDSDSDDSSAPGVTWYDWLRQFAASPFGGQ